MPAIAQVRAAAAAATKSPTAAGPSPKDLKTAAGLKGSVLEVLKRVRFGQPLSAADSPKSNTKGEWKAPNGDKLIAVSISKPPPGMADGMSTAAYVNPKTNQFYSGTFGGFAGVRFFHGPLSLPTGVKFTGKSFSASDIAALTRAANGGGGGTVKVPTKTAILNALGTYEFHKLIKYGTKGPAASNVLKEVPLRAVAHPDGYSYTGLVLKSDPNTVVIRRTGGFAGLVSYSQPIDTTRLPK
jgi:hypothetical protein